VTDLSQFKVEQEKIKNNFADKFKSYFLSPLVHGIVGFTFVLITTAIVKLFFLKAANEFHFIMNSYEMIFSLLAGILFFIIKLKKQCNRIQY